MVLKCVAIDDEPLALQLLETYAARIPNLKMITTFEDAISGAEFLNKNEIDLLFLDINMPDISGTDLARALIKKSLIIFTTAYKEFAFEGFELQAMDYLLKPIEFESFSRACHKAIDYKLFLAQTKQIDDDAHIYVNSGYRQVKVLINDIEYVESMQDYVILHIDKQEPLHTLMTLKRMLELLPEKKFTRIHRSFVVQVSRIKSIRSKKVNLETISLPIGDAYAAQLKRY